MHKFYEDDNFTISIQWATPTCPLIHANVRKWSKSVCVKMWSVWYDLRAHLEAQGCGIMGSVIPSDDQKILKFNEMFGMRVFSDDGKTKTMVQEL